MLFPAIFLDRDGVIIQNRPLYVRTWKDVRFIPNVKNALARISMSNYRIVIVTNQSAVGRKIISLEQANLINEELVKKITDCGGRVDGVFMCPHHPDAKCPCRKPSPGLLLQAADKLKIDLGSSIIFGDTWGDLLAGYEAGVRKYGLVLTGRGKEQISHKKPERINDAKVYSNLVVALNQLY